MAPSKTKPYRDLLEVIDDRIGRGATLLTSQYGCPDIFRNACPISPKSAVGGSERLPGGWGITVDDFLAALYVDGVFLLAYLAWPK